MPNQRPGSPSAFRLEFASHQPLDPPPSTAFDHPPEVYDFRRPQLSNFAGPPTLGAQAPRLWATDQARTEVNAIAEAARSLVRHDFRHFLILNAQGSSRRGVGVRKRRVRAGGERAGGDGRALRGRRAVEGG